MIAMALLGGCVSLPADLAGGTADTSALLHQAADGADQLVYTIAGGGEVDFPALQLSFERARMAVVSQLAGGIGRLGVQQLAGLGALGATLLSCQDGAARLQLLLQADPAAAALQARTGFWTSCSMPLALGLNVIS